MSPSRSAVKVRRGLLIGAGYFAQFQAEAWKRLPGARIIAVADSHPGRARAFARRHGFRRAYTSAASALAEEGPDFVDIVTRPETHLELTSLAASHGAHVICQKPMAPALHDCLAMCAACERAGVRLLIHENWRWQPWYRESKRWLDQGWLGQPVHASFYWRSGDGRGAEPYALQPYFQTMPRLLVYESLVHVLDTYRYLLGDLEVVDCQLGRINPVIAGEDLAWIQVRFRNGGVVGRIDGNRVTGPVPAPVTMGSLILEGQEATLRLAGDGTLWVARRGQEEEQVPFEPTTAGYRGDSVYAAQAHLLEALSSGQASESDGRDYLKTVALVEDCYRLAGAVTEVVDPVLNEQ
ncbi:MAG TPA: Gfo/Idh/MocA family oxidoreductase [Verrucomicrobiae bacterium]|nr:Gfo/Idh/MocA family oxidoreductase [Verrucomicrobiae bacterium]